jgi:hypothetical protein
MRRYQNQTHPLTWAKVNGNLRENPGEEEELKRLARSYKKRPVHPLITRPDGTMLDGTRRVLGLRLIGETEADFLITDEDLRPEDILEIQLVTAIHRAGLTGHEKWQGGLRLMQLHPEWQHIDLANFLDITPASVTHMLSPSKCLTAIQEALKAGRITLSDCYTMSKASEAEQHGLLAAKLGGATRDELERRGRKARNAGKPTVKAPRIKIELPSGVTVTFAAKNTALDLDQAIEAASEAHKVMKKGQEQGLTAKTIQKVSTDRAKAGT